MTFCISCTEAWRSRSPDVFRFRAVRLISPLALCCSSARPRAIPPRRSTGGPLQTLALPCCPFPCGERRCARPLRPSVATNRTQEGHHDDTTKPTASTVQGCRGHTPGHRRSHRHPGLRGWPAGHAVRRGWQIERIHTGLCNVLVELEEALDAARAHTAPFRPPSFHSTKSSPHRVRRGAFTLATPPVPTFNAGARDAALVAINFLQSPVTQARKADIRV